MRVAEVQLKFSVWEGSSGVQPQTTSVRFRWPDELKLNAGFPEIWPESHHDQQTLVLGLSRVDIGLGRGKHAGCLPSL